MNSLIKENTSQNTHMRCCPLRCPVKWVHSKSLHHTHEAESKVPAEQLGEIHELPKKCDTAQDMNTEMMQISVQQELSGCSFLPLHENPGRATLSGG